MRTPFFYHCLTLFLAGAVYPLGFAPFHWTGLTLISLAVFYFFISRPRPYPLFFSGFFYGLGVFLTGVSWVIVSIHDYGMMNYFLSALVTLLFLFYLSLYPALAAFAFNKLQRRHSPLLHALLFSALWVLTEAFRAHWMTGFPWLLSGTIQIDTPMRNLAPIIGVYGLGFLSCLSAALIVEGLLNKKRSYLILMASFYILPYFIPPQLWTHQDKKPLSVAVIQANLSMRDKWDEALFWQMLDHYQKATQTVLGKSLIVFPESAIPLPSNYLEDYLDKLSQEAAQHSSAIVLGILKPADEDETRFYNTVATLGLGEGEYIKRHLVPFGEYIPQPFQKLNRWLQLPDSNLESGNAGQDLINVQGHAVATLICYEIAYPQLLRQALNTAQWIISISDNGWFGHSLASYQQLQMAQMTSLLTGRYQVLANNDGLSSIITAQGTLAKSLPAFQAGILQSELYPASGLTPWARWGDYPLFFICTVLILIVLFQRKMKNPEKSSIAAGSK